MLTLPRALLITLTLLAANLARAGDQIAHLLDAKTPPTGVVFEVVQRDGDALQWAIPQIRDYVTRLRARYPELALAVVTHGKEQFALQTRRQKEYGAVHQGVQALVGDQVQVHVCGTHAGWYGISAEDFPSYVDVAPAGPTQIRDYQELGYELVRLEAPRR